MQKFFWFDLHAGVHAYASFAFISACLSTTIMAYQYITYQPIADLLNVKSSYTMEWEQLAGVHAVFIVLLASLAYGTHNKRRFFLLPYMLVIGIISVLLVGAIIVNSIINPLILLLAPTVGFLLYTHSAVLALFIKMGAQQDNQNTTLYVVLSAPKESV